MWMPTVRRVTVFECTVLAALHSVMLQSLLATKTKCNWLGVTMLSDTEMFTIQVCLTL